MASTKKRGLLQRRISLFGPDIFRRHREKSLHHDGGPPHPVPNGIFQTLGSSYPVDPSVGPLDVVLLTVQQEIHRRSAEPPPNQLQPTTTAESSWPIE